MSYNNPFQGKLVASLVNIDSLLTLDVGEIVIDSNTGIFYGGGIDNAKIAFQQSAFTLPTASADTKGGVKVGSRLSIADAVLSADVQSDNNFTTTLKNKLDNIEASANNYSLPTASADVKGGVKVGTGLTIADSVLSLTDGDNVLVPSTTPVNAVASSNVLTFNSNPLNNETVTIDTTTYTFQIIIEETGTKASSILTFTDVPLNTEAVKVETDSTYTYVTALTEAKATGTLTLTGAGKDGETIVINSRVYELDSNSSITGDVAVDISAGTKVGATDTLTLTDDDIAEGQTVTIGSKVFEVDADGVITEGNIAVNCSATMVRAEGVFSIAGANPSINDTITIDAITYIFTDTPASANDVLIGLTIDDTIDNLIHAILDDFGEGTLYGADTVANTAVIPTKLSGTRLKITNKVYGAVGNATDFTYSMTDVLNTCDGGGHLGGTTLGVDCTAANFDGYLITAIDTDATYEATQGAGTTVDVSSKDGSLSNGTVCATTVSGATWGNSELKDGTDCTAAELDGYIITAITGDTGAEVTAAQGAGTSVVATAKLIGEECNYIIETTLTNGTWGNGTLEGGTDAIPNEVVIGTVEVSINNLVAACNGTAGEGTTYSTGTTHVSTVAVTKVDATHVKSEALEYGEAGNSIVIGETLTNASWTGGVAHLSGGEEPENTNDVLIGSNTNDTIDNLAQAISNGYVHEVTGSGTMPHPLFTAQRVDSTLATQARVKGAAANGKTLGETLSDVLSVWDSALTTGGVSATIGIAGQMVYSTGYLYICLDTNPVSGTQWRRVELGTVF